MVGVESPARFDPVATAAHMLATASEAAGNETDAAFYRGVMWGRWGRLDPEVDAGVTSQIVDGDGRILGHDEERSP